MNKSSVRAAGAIPSEFIRVYFSLVKLGLCDLPYNLVRSFWEDSQLDHVLMADRLYDILGETLLGCFDSLGPVYGKAGQVLLSRLSEQGQSVADRLRLTRLYGDWPPLSFDEVSQILDKEIPQWRAELRVDPNPLGVASMAQVHKAETQDGKEWAVKIIKPQSKKRLLQTLAALDQGISLFKTLKLTQMASRLIKELEEVSGALRLELALDLEKDNIDKVRSKLASKKTQVLRIPETLDKFSTENVLTLECFSGTPVTDLVTQKTKLSSEMKRKLARKMLNELLIQVFEVGLFHADPHAGNLILLEDGSIGLFDWGLTGVLTESDRKHIAAILKAVLSLNLDRLAEALYEMSKDAGRVVEVAAIRKTLDRLAGIIKKRKAAGKALPMHEVLDESLKAAEKLNIEVPSGLLLMAKSLLTIEGLARGMDPNISLARIATPVLFKAAKPGMKDMLLFSRRVPGLAKQFLFGSEKSS